MEPSRYAELFLSESRAHISSINHHLLELERSGSAGSVEELFRAAHTLKGMSAAMGCQGAAELAHSLEHLLDRIQEGQKQLDEVVMECLFESADALEETIAAEIAGESSPASVAPLLARIQLLGGAVAGADTTHPTDVLTVRTPSPERKVVLSGTRVTAMIQTSAALPAVRAMLVLRAARGMGEVSFIEPSEEDLLAGRFAGTLNFVLQTGLDADSIREQVLRAGEVAHVLVEEIAPVLPPPREATASDHESVRVLDAYVRISQQLLDTMVNRIGELVIARDRLRVLIGREQDPALEEASEQISGLIGEMRDDVMRMRMVPIGDAFDRFPRFIRDASRALDKDVRFEITGKDTPLDRSLHNELAGVLIHLLRNALDHGIEPSSERVARHKPPRGLVRLCAAAERSHVVVKVEDDGCGIDLERVADAAVEAGFLSRDAAAGATRDELLQLLTRAGFSTRREVTDVSGRGVGLDVVASRVRAAGGSLEIETTAGEGTCFTLRLPLSLAILRTLLVEVGGVTFTVPIAMIQEVAELGFTDEAWSGKLGSMRFRDETLPVLCLSSFFHPALPARRDARAPVVIAHGPDGLFGILVSQLHGQHEAVMKPFDSVRGMPDVFSGATVLSDGRAALVVDALKLGRFADSSPEDVTVHAAAAQS
jgi:two-component system, chemotaxis family, sensor kinase CheA